MKFNVLVIVVLALVYSCNHPDEYKESEIVKAPPEKQNFFPVTSYLKGQLYDFRKYGINPIKYTTVKNHTDSVWLRIEEFDQEVDRKSVV